MRNMVYECAWRVYRGEDVRDRSYMVKVMATEMASRMLGRRSQLDMHFGVQHQRCGRISAQSDRINIHGLDLAV